MSRLSTLAVPLVCFTIAVYWLFFQGPPPKTTANASLLWLSPILLAVFVSFTQLFLPSTKRNKTQTIDTLTLDLQRSTISTATILLTICTSVFQLMGKGKGKGYHLKPLNTDDFNSIAEWMKMGSNLLAIVFGVGGFCALFSIRVMIDWCELRQLKELEEKEKGK